MDPVILETLDRSLIFPELAAEGVEKILIRRKVLRPGEFLLHAGHGITEGRLICSFWALLDRTLAVEPPEIRRCAVRLFRGGPRLAFHRVVPTLTRREDPGRSGTRSVIHFRVWVDADHCEFPLPLRHHSF